MAKNSQEYWNERARQDKIKVIKTAEYGVDNLKKLLKKNLDSVEKQIKEFYKKYGDEGKYAESLSYAEFQKYKAKLRLKAKQNPQDKTLQRLAKQDIPKYRIDRLRALQTDLQIQLTEATRGQEAGIYKTLKDVAKVSQATTALRFKKTLDVAFDKIASRKLEKILSSDWVGNMNWSERLWKDREVVGKKVTKILETGLPQGKSMQEMARELKDATQSSFNDAFRLIRTESAHVDGEVLLESFKQAQRELGYTKYIFDATIDSRTSEICEHEDNKSYLIDEAVIGENFPPLHPNCRSTAVLDESSIDESVIEDSKQEEDFEKDINVPSKEIKNVEETLNNYEENRPAINNNISTNEIVKDVDRIEITDEIRRYDRFGQGEDLRTKAILNNSDYLDKPQVLSPKDFDKLGDDYIKVFRGVNNTATKTAIEINEQYRTGKAYIGKGLYGGGTYTTPHKATAQGFGSDDLIEIAFKKNARIINYSDLEEKLDIVRKEVNSMEEKLEFIKKELVFNKTNIAKEMGYDIVQVDYKEWKQWLKDTDKYIEEYGEEFKAPYYVILNRKVTIAKGK